MPPKFSPGATCELWQSCAASDEDCVVAAFFHEFRYGVCSADQVAQAQVNAEFLDVVDFVVDDGFG